MQTRSFKYSECGNVRMARRYSRQGIEEFVELRRVHWDDTTVTRVGLKLSVMFVGRSPVNLKVMATVGRSAEMSLDSGPSPDIRRPIRPAYSIETWRNGAQERSAI